MQRQPRLNSVIATYRGIPYELDLVRCRRALVRLQVAGEVHDMASLPRLVKISRSTASRFFSGRPASLTVALRILAVLRLGFDEVATPVQDEAHVA